MNSTGIPTPKALSSAHFSMATSLLKSQVVGLGKGLEAKDFLDLEFCVQVKAVIVMLNNNCVSCTSQLLKLKILHFYNMVEI